MEAKAYLRYLRISPRKVQILCDLIRGKDVNTASAILMNTPKAGSEPVLKLLKSAVANAQPRPIPAPSSSASSPEHMAELTASTREPPTSPSL